MHWPVNGSWVYNISDPHRQSRGHFDWAALDEFKGGGFVVRAGFGPSPLNPISIEHKKSWFYKLYDEAVARLERLRNTNPDIKIKIYGLGGQ